MEELNKKELGAVLTPPRTADYIVSRLGQVKENQKVLDPCSGSGVFVKSLLKYGVSKTQIHAYDINPNYKKEIERLGVSFEAKDTLLSMTPDSFNQFDYIVGNPPYLNKASSYVRKNRLKLKKIYEKTNAHETYSMFIVNSIWRLKEGGKLGFITSDSFLTLNTHTRLRKFILNNCKIEEILSAPKNLFDDQNVGTSPVIILFTKFSGKENVNERQDHVMRIIPRVESENNYQNPKTIHEFEQKRYNLLPFNLFFTDVEEQIIELFENSSKLENYLKGNIGMHTHDNLKYIAAVEGTKLAKIFEKHNERNKESSRKYKIITKKDLDSGKWKPYLKRGGSDQYYRPIIEALDWTQDSIPIYDIPKNVPFEEEGVVISGISSKLAARYMPKGCYWDSNKAIGFTIVDKSMSIEYALGLLNSSLYNYIAKGIINNTNSIQITGIHALPFVSPDIETTIQVEQLVKKIIDCKKRDLDYDYTNEQKQIDDNIFDFYGKRFNFTKNLKKKLDLKYSIYRKSKINSNKIK